MTIAYIQSLRRANVALLVMRGMSNREVADALHRDITTVKDHLTHIYGKLGIRSRTQLAAMLAGS